MQENLINICLRLLTYLIAPQLLVFILAFFIRYTMLSFVKFGYQRPTPVVKFPIDTSS